MGKRSLVRKKIFTRKKLIKEWKEKNIRKGRQLEGKEKRKEITIRKQK